MRPAAGKAFWRPDQNLQALALRGGDLEARRAGCAQHALDVRDLLGDFLRRAVGFDEQDGRGLEVVAGAHEGLDRRGRLAVHHLERRRNDARGDHRRHRVAGAVHVGERGHDQLYARRARDELHHHLGDDHE